MAVAVLDLGWLGGRELLGALEPACTHMGLLSSESEIHSTYTSPQLCHVTLLLQARARVP